MLSSSSGWRFMARKWPAIATVKGLRGVVTFHPNIENFFTPLDYDFLFKFLLQIYKQKIKSINCTMLTTIISMLF